MKKPEFPKPRIIREDFLPKQDIIKNYRIKKVTDGYSTSYYPQEKLFGLFWHNLFASDYSSGSYPSFEEAQTALCNFLRKPVVEYLDFDCGEN